jgi:hypothetical protein
VQAEPDGTTQRRVGRKLIVAPEGCEIVPTNKPQPMAPWSGGYRISSEKPLTAV